MYLVKLGKGGPWVVGDKNSQLEFVVVLFSGLQNKNWSLQNFASSTLQFYWIVNSSAALQFLKIPFFYQTLLNFAAYSTFEGHISCTECKGEVYCY